MLANPSSGKGRGGRAAEAAVLHLRSRGAEVRAYAGGSAADTARLAVAALADDPRALVVVGGDGTLSGILDTVCAAAAPVVLVPAGTGNDLARALGLPRGDAAAAAELALTGVPDRSMSVRSARRPGRGSSSRSRRSGSTRRSVTAPTGSAGRTGHRATIWRCSSNSCVCVRWTSRSPSTANPRGGLPVR